MAPIAGAVGDGGEDDLRAAELLQLARPGRLGLAVDVVRRAELPRERFLVLPAGDGDGAEAHLRGVLHAQVAEAADAEDGDDVAGDRAAVAQGVKRREAGAHERRGVDRWASPPGTTRQRRRRGDHVVGVTAVEGDAR